MSLEDLKDNLAVLNSFEFGNDFILGMSSIIEDSPNSNYPSTSPLNLNSSATITDATFYETELLRVKQDIAIIKESGIHTYRFSLSWSQILPDGIGKINYKAIEFYHAILDACLENGIKPFVTLYDAILPEALNEKGGWSNREILNWFEEYVSHCVAAFKDKVNHWILFNDPCVFTGAHDFISLNTIGKEKVTTFLAKLHHTQLSQSVGFKTIKKIAEKAQVGVFFSCNYGVPLSFTNHDLRTVERVDALLNRLYIEPSLGLGYPEETLPFLKRISKYMLPEDNELIKVDFDFIGLNNYTRKIVTYNSYRPYLNAKILQYETLRNKKNHLGLELYNELIYTIIKKYSDYNGVKKIYITDTVTPIEEPKNLNSIIGNKKSNTYISFLHQVHKANQNGGKVKGLFTLHRKQN